MVASHVLDSLATDGLRVYAVWEPILGTDNEPAARKATSLLSDHRVTHFWTATRDVGRMFQTPLHLESEPAWDVYLVYPPGTTWSDEPPRPSYFMHQLRGRLPGERTLDGAVLADTLRATLVRP